MVNVRGIARLGTLAALGVAAAGAWSTGAARADSSSDWLSSIDGVLAGEALPAASGLNLAVSFDGMSLLHDGNATATTASGEYGLAIAYGDGASATAEGGTGDYAFADGAGAIAAAGGITGSTGNDFDSAIDIGTNSPSSQFDGAYAGQGQLVANAGSPGSGEGSFDTAIEIGNNGTGTFDNGAHAGAGGLVGLGGDGNHDVAIDFGNNSNGFDQGADAVGGNGDSASYLGNITADSANGNFAYAGFGDNNAASVVGDNSYAYSGGSFDPGSVSDNNIATVFDPFGTLGSTAIAGTDDISNIPGNFDLAAAFGDGLFPEATGANYLAEILPTLF